MPDDAVSQRQADERRALMKINVIGGEMCAREIDEYIAYAAKNTQDGR